MIHLFPALLRPSSWRVVLFFCFFFGISISAVAGYAGGPYVVWVNLDHSSDKERINKVISSYATSKPVNCDGLWRMGDSLLYMKKRPPLIDDYLVDGVFLKKEIAQRKRLNAALKNYKDADFRINDGLDGVIMYTTQGIPRMMRLTTGKNRIESITLALRDGRPLKEDIEDAFCALLPPITRAP